MSHRDYTIKKNRKLFKPPLDLYDVGFVGAVQGAGLDPIDDDGLVCLYNFDESSLVVPNSSESSDSGGSNFDATAVGAAYSTPGHFGNCFSFDGTDDYMQPDISGGVNLTQWNWLHTGVSWSMTYWLRRFNLTNGGRLWDQAYDGSGTLANATTNNLFSGDTGDANLMVTNNTAGRPLDLAFSTDFYNGDDWHLYVHTYDSSTTTLTSTLDNTTTVTGSKHPSRSFSSNDSTTDMTFMSQVGLNQELSAEVQVWTFWDVVIDSGVQDAIWNNGDGRAFY